MYGLSLPNPPFIPTQMRTLPGMPDSYTPPWVVQGLPESMIQPLMLPDGRILASQQMSMHQMAMTPPPIVPTGNRMVLPSPVLTDPNCFYALPPLTQQYWMG